MSKIEKVGVMPGTFQRIECEEQQVDSEIDVDLHSRGLHRNANQTGDFRSLSNTNSSEKGGTTVDTSTRINSEIKSQTCRR